MIKMFSSHTIKSERRYDFSSLSSIIVTGAPSSQSTLNGARDFLVENGASKDLRIERALGDHRGWIYCLQLADGRSP
jgi:hypothetical protein